MSEQDPLIFNLESDASGNWNLDVFQQVDPGVHLVEVEDEKGNQHQVMMYVVKDQETQTQRITFEPIQQASVDYHKPVVMSLLFLLIIFLFFLIYTCYRLYLIWVGKNPSDREEKEEKKYNTLVVLILLAVLVIFIGAGMISSTGRTFIKHWFQTQNLEYQAVDLSGRLIDPLTLQGVAGVDLQVQDTSIRTSETGSFVFNQVNTQTGVKLTQPELLRALIYLPSNQLSSQQPTLYFNIQALNTLIRAIDLEARDKHSQVYDLLAPQIQVQINSHDYAQSADTYFSSQNLTDQYLALTETVKLGELRLDKYGLTFNNILAITVRVNDQLATYHLKYQDNQWWLVK